MSPPAPVEIDGGVQRPCPIIIQPGLLDSPDLATSIERALGVRPRTMLAVLDTGIPAEVRATILDRLGSPPSLELTPSETDKRLGTLERILAACCNAGLDRDEPIIAIGGGIVGDLAGFAAATYQRGVPVIQCPSTLLAMVDASVGGKTGVNLVGPDGALLKNMAGAFHQPHAVLIDPLLLESLAPRVYASGLAECVKHGLLAADADDPGLFEWLETNTHAIATRDRPLMPELIARNVRVKASIVRSDERELAAVGGRALLNLGHTFAHAIEPITTLSPSLDPKQIEADAPLHHGEAVALGVVAACHAAELAEVGRVEALLRAFSLPVRVLGLPSHAELRSRMAHDKKSRSGNLRLVLPTSLGTCRVVDRPRDVQIERGWSALAPA